MINVGVINRLEVEINIMFIYLSKWGAYKQPLRHLFRCSVYVLVIKSYKDNTTAQYSRPIKDDLTVPLSLVNLVSCRRLRFRICVF